MANDAKWNPALWAEQGYVIVMPNIAGSVGYGLDFTASKTPPFFGPCGLGRVTNPGWQESTGPGEAPPTETSST